MKLYLLMLSVVVVGCSAFKPTGYIEREDCGIGGELSFKAACYGGYSSTIISENKFMVTFEGNEFTTLQRATDLAIFHCSELTLKDKNKFMSIEIVERKIITSVNASNGNASTSTYPIASIYCDISNIKNNKNIEAEMSNQQLKSKLKLKLNR